MTSTPFLAKIASSFFPKRSIQAITPLLGGYANRAWMITFTDQQQFVLKNIRKNRTEGEERLRLQVEMADHVNSYSEQERFRIRVPRFMKTSDGSSWIIYEGEIYCIQEFISGRFAQWGAADGVNLRPVVEAIAQLRIVLASLSIPFDQSPNGYRYLPNQLHDLAQTADVALQQIPQGQRTISQKEVLGILPDFLSALCSHLDRFSSAQFEQLPKQWIHGDLGAIHLQMKYFPDHSSFVSWIIDWEEMNVNTPLWDLACGLFSPVGHRMGETNPNQYQILWDDIDRVLNQYGETMSSLGTSLPSSEVIAFPHILSFHPLRCLSWMFGDSRLTERGGGYEGWGWLKPMLLNYLTFASSDWQPPYSPRRVSTTSSSEGKENSRSSWNLISLTHRVTSESSHPYSYPSSAVLEDNTYLVLKGKLDYPHVRHSVSLELQEPIPQSRETLKWNVSLKLLKGGFHLSIEEVILRVQFHYKLRIRSVFPLIISGEEMTNFSQFHFSTSLKLGPIDEIQLVVESAQFPIEEYEIIISEFETKEEVQLP